MCIAATECRLLHATSCDLQAGCYRADFNAFYVHAHRVCELMPAETKRSAVV
jgi:hypothetical protein